MRSASPPLAMALWPSDDKTGRLVRAIVLIAAGSVLMTVSAKLTVPFWPVPLSMQTFAALLIGAAYGWRLGGITVLAYLAQGAMGVPVFAGAGAGLSYLLGPTGGYLLGFAIGAVVVGWLAERGWDRRVLTTLAAMVIGNLGIYALGVGWLTTIVGSVERAFALGLLPFLLGDALKIALATALLPFAWSLIQRR